MQFPNKGHFLDGKEMTPASLNELLILAETLKSERAEGILRDDLKGKTLALLFDKPSLRTRMSFTVAMTELGGNVIEAPANLRKHEEPEDLAGVMSRYVHGIMIRTHAHEGLMRFVSRSKVPVMNGLTDEHHPCQSLADILTLKQAFGSTEGLVLTYIGDGNNILHSLMVLAPMAGIHLQYAAPAAYQPDGKLLEWCQMRKGVTGSVKAFKTPEEAVLGSNAIYTDVWTSMGFESENVERVKAFAGYQVNAELYAKAAPQAIVLHCMPMVRGQEITSEMADHDRSFIYQQAENRLHVQKALLWNLLR
jgi:ornithine carbamoyltransferase